MPYFSVDLMEDIGNFLKP